MSRAHLHGSLPAASPHAGTSISQSKSHVLAGVQDAYWSDDEAEDAECPLCLEEMDISDINFKPCVCGYQICRFCWHHIKENLNKKCPACRRVYTDDTVEFKPVNTKDHKRLTQQKKQRERERKELDQLGRRHLVNVRVVQRNVVYLVGIGPRFAKEELIPTLRSHDYFGQYGKISKILIVKRTPSGGGSPVVGLYVTFHRKEDAARCIAAVDGSPSPGGGREVMRASYGTTKYCMAFLRGASCNDQNCMNLHEWGDEKDCFTKEDLTTLKHTMKATESRTRTITVKKGHDGEVGLPRAASWAQKPVTTHAPSSVSGPALAPPIRQSRRAPTTKQIRASTSAPSTGSEARGSSGRTQEAKPPPPPLSPPSPPSVSASVSVESPAAPVDVEEPTPTPASDVPPPPETTESPVPPAPPSPAPSGVSESDQEISSQQPSEQPSEQPSQQPSQPPSQQPSQPPSQQPSQQPTPALPEPPLPPGLPLVPPGLPPPPPGLPPPPGIGVRPLRTESASPQTPLLSSSSSYQMSTAARALLDDVKARREHTDPQTAILSPFPDLDRTLQSLTQSDDGGFSFNLDPNLIAEGSGDLSGSDFQFEGNAPFSGSYLDAFPSLRVVTNPQPPLMYPPGLQPIPQNSRPGFGSAPRYGMSGRESQAPSPTSYMGSFNPFGEPVEDRSESLTSSPALTHRSHTDDEMSRGVSRFGFARGKQPLSQKSSLRQVNPTPNDLFEAPVSKLQSLKIIDTPAYTTPSMPPHFSGPPVLQHPQAFGSDVTESQLRDFIQSSKERAMLNGANHEMLSKGMAYPTQFRDPAIVSAPFIQSHVNESYNQALAHGPPPGLSFPPNRQEAMMRHNPAEFNVSTPPSPKPSPVFSASDFPALQPSLAADNSPRDTSNQSKSVPAIKTLEQAQKKASKLSPTVESPSDRTKTTPTAAKPPERPKNEKAKVVEADKPADPAKSQPKEQPDKAEKPAAETRRVTKKESIIQPKPKSQSSAKSKPAGKGDEAQRNKPSAKVTPVSAPEEPSIQVPLLSKKPKKNKPIAKPIKAVKEGSSHDTPPGTPPATSADATFMPTSIDKSTSTSDLHPGDYDLPTPVYDLMEEINISNPSMDLPNHPFFDLHKLHPTATMPLEYGPLVHALSALSVGGGSFSHNMPSGSIDNAVSSFQQLLETLTQTISDLLRLLPRTTWDDSSSFDGVLRDMLKGDDFLDDAGEDSHGKDDEVAALTLALERRARWMEVQLSKLEELHRDINTAAVRAILSFNDNGWDPRGFLPRTGTSLRKFDNLGLVEENGDVRSMNSDELNERLEVAKDAALLAETELREAMERMQAIRPVGTEIF